MSRYDSVRRLVTYIQKTMNCVRPSPGKEHNILTCPIVWITGLDKGGVRLRLLRRPRNIIGLARAPSARTLRKPLRLRQVAGGLTVL